MSLQKEIVNPFLPLHTYIPDGEPHVFGSRVFLYGSHDKERGESFCLLDYEVWSAPVDDLTSWSCPGTSYCACQDPAYSEGMPYMYAPDCAQGPDGRFYLYYCLAGWRGKGGYSNPISVAVCDTPDGHFEYLGVVRNADGTPMMQCVNFDPAVLNDNGIIHLYTGSALPWIEEQPESEARLLLLAETVGRTPEETSHGITGAYHLILEPDMLTVQSGPDRIDTRISGHGYSEHPFFEGSSIRKAGERFYFIYSSRQNHELCYAVSPYPDREFLFGGTIISNGDIGYLGRLPEDRLNHTGTTHGSIECICGQWYVFYHRLTHASDYCRQACAEPICISGDGFIPQAELSSCGLNSGPLTGGQYPAAICCNLTNGHMLHGSNSNLPTDEPCITSDGSERYICRISDGTMIGYKYFSFWGTVRLTLCVRGGCGVYEVGCPAVSARIPVPASEHWTEVSVEFTVFSEKMPLFLLFRGSGQSELLSFRILPV